MKIAIAHYWFTTWRGGEKVVDALLELFPQADLYTMFCDPETQARHFPNQRVFTSRFNTPFFRKHYQLLFPFYPLIIWTMRLQGHYDLLISSESGPIRAIQKPRQTKHICYIHTPMRYAWGFTHEYLRVIPKMLRPLASLAFKWLKFWDKSKIDVVDLYIANSENVRARVQTYYQRDAKVIPPPIAESLFEQRRLVSREKPRTHFLCFGALVPYKRIDLAVQCFNQNGLPLLVVGAGSELKHLKQLAQKNVTFKSNLSDEEVREVILDSHALIFPGEEDFGMIPLEVMAHGVPVLAFKQGGALETVVEKESVPQSTGIFFEEQTCASLQTCIDRFLAIKDLFDPVFISGHAQTFSSSIFQNRMKTAIEEFMNSEETEKL